MGQSYWTQNGHQQPDRGYHTHGSRLLNPARTYTAWKVVNIQSQGYWTQNGHTQSNRWLSYIMGQGYWTQHGRPQPDRGYHTYGTRLLNPTWIYTAWQVVITHNGSSGYWPEHAHIQPDKGCYPTQCEPSRSSGRYLAENQTDPGFNPFAFTFLAVKCPLVFIFFLRFYRKYSVIHNNAVTELSRDLEWWFLAGVHANPCAFIVMSCCVSSIDCACHCPQTGHTYSWFDGDRVFVST